MRIDSAPPRRKFPRRDEFDDKSLVRGRIIYLRRTDDEGDAQLLGRIFPVRKDWRQRLVRAVVDLDTNLVQFFALRRLAPDHQPMLRQIEYALPERARRG